jgi:hypothetical protein
LPTCGLKDLQKLTRRHLDAASACVRFASLTRQGHANLVARAEEGSVKEPRDPATLRPNPTLPALASTLTERMKHPERRLSRPHRVPYGAGVSNNRGNPALVENIARPIPLSLLREVSDLLVAIEAHGRDHPVYPDGPPLELRTLLPAALSGVVIKLARLHTLTRMSSSYGDERYIRTIGLISQAAASAATLLRHVAVPLSAEVLRLRAHPGDAQLREQVLNHTLPPAAYRFRETTATNPSPMYRDLSTQP